MDAILHARGNWGCQAIIAGLDTLLPHVAGLDTEDEAVAEVAAVGLATAVFDAEPAVVLGRAIHGHRLHSAAQDDEAARVLGVEHADGDPGSRRRLRVFNRCSEL